MRKSSFVPALARVLFSLLLLGRLSASGQTLHVTTTLTTASGLPSPNDISVCDEIVYLTTTIVNDAGGGGGYVDQTLPAGWTVDTSIDIVSGSSGGSAANFPALNYGVIRYSIYPGSTC